MSLTDKTTAGFNNCISNSLKKHEALRGICSSRHVNLTNAALCYKAILIVWGYMNPALLHRRLVLYSRSTGYRQECAVFTAPWEEPGQRQSCKCCTAGRGSSKAKRTAFLHCCLFLFSLLQMRNPPPFFASHVRAEMRY